MKPMNDPTNIKADQESSDALKRMIEKYNHAYRQERRMIMKPMIGQIVHYTNVYGETLPAIITKVFQDPYECVDLCVFSNHGLLFEPMVRHGEQNSRYDYWEYMPLHQHMIIPTGGEQE